MKKITAIILTILCFFSLSNKYNAEAYDSKDFKAELERLVNTDENGRNILQDYMIRCHYPSISQSKGTDFAFTDIDVFIFENDSVAYFYADSPWNEIEENKIFFRAKNGITSALFAAENLKAYGVENHIAGGISGLNFNYSTADLYNAVIKSYNERKTCPDLILYHTGTTTQVGTIYYSKEEKAQNIANAPNKYAITEGSSATLTVGDKYKGTTNPGGQTSETPGETEIPEIIGPKETSTCPEIDLTSEYQYQANLRQYTNTDQSVKVRLLMKDDGRRYAEVTYGNDRIGYTTTTREITSEGMEVKINGSFAYVCLKAVDVDWIFSQDDNQKKNNTFTCDMNDIKVFSWDDSDSETTRNSVCISFQSQARIDYEKGLKDKDIIISDKVGFCVDYLGSARTKGTLANLLDKAFTVVKIGAILVAIILSMLDLTGVITKNKDELKPTIQKIVKRAVILIIILLLPTIIDMVFSLFGYKEVLCGIR